MGRKKYIQQVEELFRKSPVVSFSSITRIVKSKRNVKQYSKQLVRNLILNGKIKKLTKGYYTSKNDISLIVFCFKPSYLGLQDALSIHNLWEQETVPIVISVNKIRQGIRKVFENNVLLRRIDKKYFFGFDFVQQGDFYFPVSDVEKTLIDMVYFRQYIDEEVVKEFRKRIDLKKLKRYLRKYPKRFRGIVLRILKKGN